MSPSTTRSSFLILALLTGSLSLAQGDAFFGARFVPFGALEVKLDGRTLDDVEVFFAERARSYLLLSSGLDQPLLIDIVSQKVERVSAAKVRKNEDGTASLLADPVIDTVGPFQVDEGQVRATLAQGRQLTLGPKPPLLGLQTADSLKAHNAAYGYYARLYPPTEKTIARLRQETRDVTVRVYFGSWCSTCGRVLPWLLSVDQALEGSNIRFEYYGLPKTMDDPEGQKMGITGVPTAVVSVGGKELGRRPAQDLGVPEKALLEILGGN